MIPSSVFRIYNKIIKKYSLFNFPKKDVFIVLGMARSGTSLSMQLLEVMGIFIGNPNELKKADQSNKKGYFEHNQLLKLSDDLIKQSGFKNNLMSEDFSLVTKNFFRKAQRFITRIEMNRFLVKINKEAVDSWALKIPPMSFPLWQAHIPAFKIIIVYRHPLIIAHSNIKLKNFKRLFHTYILTWERLYREFLYYCNRYPSIVISYDDLLNPDEVDRVLKKLIDFTGKGDIDNLKKAIIAGFNESSEINKLIGLYPLPQSTKKVLEALNKIKA
jgi:hypothetical protein